MAQTLKQQQKIASFFIIAMVMWEFFSYFGLQSILILYLTSQLHFTDSNAYQLYGSFTSLIFITPIIGGWLADRYCGYRYATGIGCLLIIFGHLVLSDIHQNSLYIGLALLTIGIGFFKSNAICLIGNCYPHDPSGKAAAFSWYYVSGNLGAIASQLLCPYLVEHASWQLGFMAAAIGMMLGMLMLLLSRRYFAWEKGGDKMYRWNQLTHSKKIIGTLGCVGSLLLVTYEVLQRQWVGHLLIITGVVAVILLRQIYRKTDKKHQSALLRIILLTAFATAFWVFDQQGSSSFVLFISRYVNRNIFGVTIATGMFQSINPMMILLVGTLMAFAWRYLAKRGIYPQPDSKLSVALVLLMLGFVVIALGAYVAHLDGLASLNWPLLSLMLIGAAEIFVDPVLLTAICEIAPAESEGQLVALYYLAVGAVANYLSIWVANLTIDPTTNKATALTYQGAYAQVAWATAILLVLLLLRIVWRKYSNSR